MNKNFTIKKFIAPEFIFGNNSRFLVSRYLKNLSLRNVLIVTDSNIITLPWFWEIIEEISKSKIRYKIYSDSVPNPTDANVMTGAEIYNSEKSDSILAIGGGSVIDSAKGIGIVVSNKRHICEFEGVDKVKIPPPPLISIPTTSGTSADVSQFAIIRDMSKLTKIAIISKTIIPDVSILDPFITETMDPFLTACTGLDALSHAFEAYVSNASSIITDFHCLNAIKLICQYLPLAVNEQLNSEARYYMMIGSLEAGLAFSNASLGAVHAMAHSLGGYYNLPHGECNALLLSNVIDYNYLSASEKYDTICSLFVEDIHLYNDKKRKEKLLTLLDDFKRTVYIDYGFSKLGVQSSDLEMLSETSLNDPCIVTNPAKLKRSQIVEIFGNSL